MQTKKIKITEIGLYAALGLALGAMLFYTYQYIKSPAGKALNPFTNDKIPPATLNDVGQYPVHVFDDRIKRGGKLYDTATPLPAQVFDEDKRKKFYLNPIDNRPKNRAIKTKWIL